MEAGVAGGHWLSPGDRIAVTQIGNDEQHRPASVFDPIPQILGKHRWVVVQNSADRALMPLQTRAPIKGVRRSRLGHRDLKYTGRSHRALFSGGNSTPRPWPPESGGEEHSEDSG
jgi:hypothetical protein